MLSAAAERRWVDWPTALHETLYAIRRAGADIVITYGAIDWASRPEPEQNCSGTT
jgi:porphobilinogen synthase